MGYGLTACIAGSSETADILIRNKADVNQKDRDGRDALQFASGAAHIKIVEILLQNANPCVNVNNQCAEG